MGDQRPPTARERVHAELRRRIVALELPPTAPLSAHDLAGELGVSRTPVHESLLMLCGEGLVEVFPQLGTIVAHMDAERVQLAQFIREAIECSALAELDTGRAAPEAIAGLENNLARQHRAARRGDLSEFFGLDEDFHRLLLTLGRRENAWPVVAREKAHLDRARRYGLTRHPLDHLIDQHRQILAEVVEGDLIAATGTLRVHLREILTDLAALQAENPELFESSGRPARWAAVRARQS